MAPKTEFKQILESFARLDAANRDLNESRRGALVMIRRIIVRDIKLLENEPSELDLEIVLDSLKHLAKNLEEYQ